MSLKYVAPLAQRLRALVRPQTFQHHQTQDAPLGVHVAEVAAARIGSWAFIGGQACVMALWVLVNTLALTGAIHFDTFPFVFLNLAMSAEAAFTGPLLLIAASAAAQRDHQQYDRMEAMERAILAALEKRDEK